MLHDEMSVTYYIPLLVRSARHTTFLVQQIENTQFAFNKIDARLIVIKVNHAPINALTYKGRALASS